jgi:lysophospholipase L1-like esterase
MKKIILINIFILNGLFCNSQDTPYKTINYDFINLQQNQIQFFGKSKIYFTEICSNLNNLIIRGEGQLKVLQIGDSHIQADYFSGQMRENLQSFALGIKGSRGFIFPYNVASTNNPDNYKVKYTGKWEHRRNITESENCDLGITGISVTTYEPDATIRIILNNHNFPFQDFNKVRIYHNNSDTVFNIVLSENQIIDNHYKTNDYSEFITENHFDTLNILLQKTDSLQKCFTLYGIELSNDDPGVIYSAVGINGAEINSFLKCNLLESQLKTLNLQWIIISLGTNDAYSANFNSDIFENNLNVLIDRIETALPDIFILLTTPPDSYRRKRYPNPNMLLASKIIQKVAKEKDCAVWNLHEVMGGFTSIKKWMKAGLAASDKVHFSRAGYALQGDLLFNAFLNAYDNIIDTGIKN